MGSERAEPPLGQALGRLSLACAARPKATVAGIAILTLAMALGMLRLETESDLLDIMPQGNPHTEAAERASQEFRGFYDLVTVFYEVDEAKCRAVSDAQLPLRVSPAACGNITDEAYVRGMDELWRFAQGEIQAAEYAIDLAGIVKTVNWTNSGLALADVQGSFVDPLAAGEPTQAGRPANGTFTMPGTDAVGEAQYEAAWRGANAADDSVKDVVAPTWKAGRTVIFFDTDSHELSRVELGREVYRMADAYDAAVRACDDGDSGTACGLRWNVFQPGLMVRGVASQDAHASDVTRQDMARLAPIALVGLVLILYLSFRDARVILVAGATLLSAFVWTAGLMGWLRIPLSALNLTIVPLILGVGIDYAIHMVSEYLDHKAQGRSDPEAFRRAGALCGVSQMVATVTTVGGLLLMVLSPSLLMRQLAVVGSIALTVCFVLSLTLIPALLSIYRRQGRQRPETGWGLPVAVAAFVSRQRPVVAIAVCAVAVLSVMGLSRLGVEALGDPQLNYPEGDRVRDDGDRINELFFGGAEGTQSHYLIVEGDLTQPRAHEFLDRLTANLEADPTIQGFNTASLTRVVRAWVNIDQGTPDAVANQLVLGQVDGGVDGLVANLPDGTVPPEAMPPRLAELQYPQTQAEIERTLDAIFASPFANFMTILLSPDGYDMGMVSFDTRQGLAYEDTEEVWDAAQAVLARTQREVPGSGLEVHQFGNSAVSYLFITEEWPWVNAVGAASFGLVTLLILAMTRSLRATLAVATVMLVTSVTWLAILPTLHVGLSVGLMLPLVFISAIGSDNAVHLIWNLQRSRDARRVHRHVGKAIVLTMATDVLAFAIFTFQTDLLVRRTMLATAASVTVMLLATLLVVPLFYPLDQPAQDPRHRHLPATPPETHRRAPVP